jgi:transglutaminase-like putative cysteine protease
MSCHSRRTTTWCVCLTVIVILTESSIAQPAWLKEAIQRGSSVAVDKDASLLVLHHSEEGKIVPSGNMAFNVCWAARILDKSGATQTGLVQPVTATRKVKNLKGWLLKPDGSKKDLAKESVIEIDIGQSVGYYDDARSLVASFNNITPGDVVAYEYTVEEKDPLTGYYTGFTFQQAQPVVWARFEVEIPPGWHILTATQQTDSIRYVSQGNLHIWTAENLVYCPTEPYMPPWSRMARSVTIGCFDGGGQAGRGFADWRAVVTWSRDLHNSACADTASLIATVDQLCGGLTSPAAKLDAIARYVRDEIRYVAVEIGMGRFQPRPAGVTLRNKYGDCKDKATLMRAMLSLAGIPSEAVVARLEGEIDPKLPSPFQFNHIIVGIPTAAVPDLLSYPDATVDGWLYFDPTNESIPLGSLSSSLRGSYVLKTSSIDSTVTQLPPLKPQNSRRRYFATAELTADLNMRASVRVVDYGLWAEEFGHSRRITPVKDMVEGWQKRFAQVVQNPVLTDYVFGSDGDSSWVSFVLSASRAATESGPYCLLNTDFFHDDQADDMTEPERVQPITFGSPAEIMTDLEWRLPQGWSPGGDPERIIDSCQLASVNCEVTHGDRVSLKSYVIYFGGEVGPEQYESMRRFNKSLRASQRVRTFLNRTGK